MSIVSTILLIAILVYILFQLISSIIDYRLVKYDKDRIQHLLKWMEDQEQINALYQQEINYLRKRDQEITYLLKRDLEHDDR